MTEDPEGEMEGKGGVKVYAVVEVEFSVEISACAWGGTGFYEEESDERMVLVRADNVIFRVEDDC